MGGPTGSRKNRNKKKGGSRTRSRTGGSGGNRKHRGGGGHSSNGVPCTYRERGCPETPSSMKAMLRHARNCPYNPDNASSASFRDNPDTGRNYW